MWQQLRCSVEQSGVAVSPERLVQISVLAALVSGVLIAILSPWWVFALPTAFCVGAIPLLYVSWRRQARLQRLCQQLPEAFELMSRAVKAGQTMTSALQMVASSGKPPLAAEFALCCEQEHLGLPLATALQDMARRTGVIELQFFVVAMIVQRQAGGNPVEILNNLSEMIRKRMRLVARVKALTGEGRMQAVVLSILPLIALAALFVLNRPYAEVLFARPWLLGAVLASEVIGTLWIRRIVNFDY
jgi:tight adherence protein B